MKTNKKLHSLTLVSVVLILFLILILSMASAATEQNAFPIITETQITTNELDQLNPVIYGDTIVWRDTRNGDRNSDIYMYNLSTQKETQITNGQWSTDPAIYGDKIVYAGVEGVYMYNLSTKKETRLLTFDNPDYITEGISYLKIYDNRIVWVDSLYADGDTYSTCSIYMYDISTNEKTQITNENLDSYYPAIYGDRIVYAGVEGVYMYNVSTKTKTRIIDEFGLWPEIYSDKLVYYANANGIYMYNLSTKMKTQITGRECSFPDIYSDRIVWEDDRSGYYNNTDIYMYDLLTSKEIQITTNESIQKMPNIYGNRIVWMDKRNGNYDVYMGTISYLPVVAFSASPISGKAPLNVLFTDLSQNANEWYWNFGDGNTSIEQNPAHKYSKTGNYTVSLTAINAEGSSTITKTDYIKVVAKPVAKFTSNVTSGKAPLTVAFSDKSTGIPTSWKWSFGDGASSTEQNPKHEYLQEGKYKVTLTVTNEVGSSTKTKTNYIKVTTNTRPGILSKSK